MASDLNRLMTDIRNARNVYITADGEIEDETEAAQNARTEEATDGRPKPRTRLKPEIFGADAVADEGVVTVALPVLAQMHSEAARFPGETGGIVVGPDSTTVTELIPSGPRARRSGASYEIDAAHLQPLLDRTEARGLQFLGVWHSHPPGFDRLSATDLAAARSILGDPDWGVDRLLLPLSVRSQGEFRTAFFLVPGPGSAPVRLHVVIAGEGDPPGARAVIALARGSFGASPEDGHFDALAGQRRVRADCEALQAAGWDVALRKTGANELFIALWRDEVHLTVLLPDEYPLSPPDVFRRVQDDLEAVPLGRLAEAAHWSSRRSLVKLAEQAAAIRPRRRLLGRLMRRGSSKAS